MDILTLVGEIDLSKKVNTDIKKEYRRILEMQYAQLREIHDATANEVRDKALEEYVGKVGGDKLRKEIEALEKKVETIKKRLEKLGLETTYRGSWSYQGPARRYIEARVAEQSKPLAALGSLVTALMACDTYGQALSIMESVLGNGQPPAILDNKIKKITQ